MTGETVAVTLCRLLEEANIIAHHHLDKDSGYITTQICLETLNKGTLIIGKAEQADPLVDLIAWTRIRAYIINSSGRDNFRTRLDDPHLEQGDTVRVNNWRPTWGKRDD